MYFCTFFRTPKWNRLCLFHIWQIRLIHLLFAQSLFNMLKSYVIICSKDWVFRHRIAWSNLSQLSPSAWNIFVHACSVVAVIALITMSLFFKHCSQLSVCSAGNKFLWAHNWKCMASVLCLSVNKIKKGTCFCHSMDAISVATFCLSMRWKPLKPSATMVLFWHYSGKVSETKKEKNNHWDFMLSSNRGRGWTAKLLSLMGFFLE